jgi:divinyl chlorophyllide a 8-vinyl-reductase
MVMIILLYISYTVIFTSCSKSLTAVAFQSSLYSRSFTNRHYNHRNAIYAHPNHVISEDNSPSIRPVVVIVAGATGYIGKAVVEESVKKNYSTLALVRSLDILETPANKQLYGNSFSGAHLLQVQVTNSTDLQDSISSLLKLQQIHSSTHDLYFVSCLASPIGTRKEAYAIDYQATLNLLHTAQHFKAHHFCLLSAFCVRNPLLQLQQAKLKMEAALQNQTSISWTIIRPTAFLKSISGQFESIQKGNSYVVFGDGAVTRCNPISQQDLADFMLTTMLDSKKHNQVYNVGGPDDPLTPKMLGEVR